MLLFYATNAPLLASAIYTRSQLRCDLCFVLVAFLQVSGLPSLPVLFIAAGGDHTLVAVRDAQPGEAVPVGPHPSRPQGLAMAPLQPPRLLELLQATQVGGFTMG